MTADRLNDLLANIPSARIGVLGDFCVDTYYAVDLTVAEPSLETGLTTRPVREQRSALGGAGNVIANLHSLGVRSIQAFAVVGDDPTGRELLRLLGGLGVNASGIVTQSTAWQTHAYLKPIIEQQESHRYDFGVFNELSPQSRARLLEAVAEAVGGLDVLIINQQFARGLHTAEFQTGLNAILARCPTLTVLADCRTLAGVYSGAIHKLNDLEATHLCGSAHSPGDLITRAETIAAGSALFRRWGRPLFVTRGKHGCIATDERGPHEIRGLHVLGKTDSVGAGDSMIAGIGACLALGASPEEAAAFGNFVAGVTVQKLHQTGSASPAEIRLIGTDPDYVYQPDLAENPREAVFQPGTNIEIADSLPANLEIRYAIFDHDGTISTLRQGWEQVMEPMMLQAILGKSYRTAEAGTFERIRRQVREFIDKTTGIQTLQQMHRLAAMVREAGYVPEEAILDAAGYKRIYNDALMRLVEERMGQLARGELAVEDFTLKNAVLLLTQLHRSGVKLYLASGTDEADVIREATALGYSGLFGGRIYGASADMTHDAKRMVLERILGEIGSGRASHLAAFGDGPVEIRETRKRGGITIGLASNEVQRFGLHPEKRTRLIRAGAQLIIPDYSQLGALLDLLRLPRFPVTQN